MLTRPARDAASTGALLVSIHRALDRLNLAPDSAQRHEALLPAPAALHPLLQSVCSRRRVKVDSHQVGSARK